MDKAFVVRKGLGVNTASPTVTVHIAANDAIWVPIGNTSQRPSGANGMFRYNSESNGFEGYANGAWRLISGDVSVPGYFKGNRGTQGTAAGANDIFRVNANTLLSNVAIADGENAMCAGPLTIDTGVELTIANGGYVTIV